MCAQRSKKIESTDQNALLEMVKASDFPEVSERSINKAAFAVCVRALLQNWRQGTVGCKDRSEVSYSNKKPWKQKGTGRARAGSARSPLWIGGGIIFGPQPRVKTLRVTKSMKRGVLNSLFWEYVENNKIGVLDWQLLNDVPKTAHASEALKNAKLSNKKITLFLSLDDVMHQSSFANIPGVNIVFFDAPNAYDVVRSDQWIVLKKDFESFKKMVATWN
ncbi:MAG: 50S ribosomal protein L4 [Candidatus Dependentiae bacterium ADurb.Bin331]|nr:MAG: 50S ribosomal protein L4 [Candidatus Dependentiae bacterium ADurb.Bin331]